MKKVLTVIGCWLLLTGSLCAQVSFERVTAAPQMFGEVTFWKVAAVGAAVKMELKIELSEFDGKEIIGMRIPVEKVQGGRLGFGIISLSGKIGFCILAEGVEGKGSERSETTIAGIKRESLREDFPEGRVTLPESAAVDIGLWRSLPNNAAIEWAHGVITGFKLSSGPEGADITLDLAKQTPYFSVPRAYGQSGIKLRVSLVDPKAGPAPGEKRVGVSEPLPK